MCSLDEVRPLAIYNRLDEDGANPNVWSAKSNADTKAAENFIVNLKLWSTELK